VSLEKGGNRIKACPRHLMDRILREGHQRLGAGVSLP
jgi:hypothetical protein